MSIRPLIRQFVKICAETLPVSEPIYEFGSFQVPGQEGFADLRVFFPGKEYVGSDIREGPGVDLILDLHDIDLPSASVGTALLLETLEHMEYLRKGIQEIHRVLRPDGLLIASSQMNFPIHNPPDYWRFTPEAFRSLLRPFKHAFVDFVGADSFPHTVVGIGFMGEVSDDVLRELRIEFQDWKKRSWRNPGDSPVKRLVRPFLAPFIRDAYHRIR